MGIVIGLIIGLVLGLTGAGGSVFAVPLLVLLASLPMSQATGVALAAVAASALYGSTRNARGGQILWGPALMLGAGGVIAAPLGQYAARFIPDLWLLAGFNVLALIIAVRMLIGARRHPEQSRVVRANPGAVTPSAPLCRLSPTGSFQWRPPCIAGLAIGGVAVGILSGLFGVGGGFLIVPLLLGISRLDMHRAVATSLVIIAAVSAAGFAGHWWLADELNGALIAQVIAGGVLGMMGGQLVSQRINHTLAQQLFAASLIGVSVITLFRG